jgi:hypothetical protein
VGLIKPKWLALKVQVLLQLKTMLLDTLRTVVHVSSQIKST